MSIIKRFGNVIKANLNALLDQAEDPEKLLNQAILDLQENKKRAQKLLVSAMAKLNMSKAQQENDQKLNEQIKTEQDTVLTIERGLKAIDQKIYLLKSELANKTISDTSSFDTFSRMEEKIDTFENEVLALNELLAAEQKDKSKAISSPNEEAQDIEKELNKLKNKFNAD